MTADSAVNARRIYQSIDDHSLDSATAGIAATIRLLNVPTGDLYSGRDGYLDYVRGWITALPDLRIRSLDITGAGDRAIAEYEIEGTHTGPLLTSRSHIPPTGMEVQLRVCDVLHFEGEEADHIRSYWDTTTLLRQLGLVTDTPLHAVDRRAHLELYAQALDGNAPERHKAIVHRFIENVYNRQNPAAAADSCSREYRWHGGTLGEASSLAAYQQTLSGLFAAFPDLGIEIHDTIAERDRVVTRFSLRGTHLGEFHGFEPTFKRVTGAGASTYRLEGDRIVEEWWQGDLLFLLQRMTAAPPNYHRPS